MKLICLVLAVFTLPFFSSGQYVWEAQQSGATEFLKDVSFLNNNQGYCVGNGGVVLKTDDGGLNWSDASYIAPLTWLSGSEDLNGVEAKSWSDIIVTSNAGAIFSSTDGGMNWGLSYFSDENLMHTTQSNNRIFVTKTNEVLYTDNMGVSWDSSVVTGVTGSVLGMHFNGNYGYAVGQFGQCAVSTDLGNTWSPVSVILSAITFHAIYTLSPTEAVAVGDNGSIFKTSNSGVLWTPITSGATSSLREIDFVSNTDGFVVGVGGTVVETNNGGASWSISSNHSMTQTIIGLDMVTDSVGYFCGDGGEIHRTPDGGGIADISVISYDGPDTVCVGIPFDFSFTFENLGPGYFANPEFLVLLNFQSLFGVNQTYSALVNAGETVNWTIPNAIVNTPGTFDINIVSLDGVSPSNNNTVLPVPQIVVVDPDPFFTSDPQGFCPGDTIALKASGGDDYLWMVAGVSNPFIDIISVMPSVSQGYVVSINQEHCSIIDTAYVFLKSDCDTAIIDQPLTLSDSYAFSPNGDGVNDTFIIDALEGTDNTVSIYNRWGDELLKFVNYNNDDVVWTGAYAGFQVPVGTYFFTITVDGSQSIAGWVQVVR